RRLKLLARLQSLQTYGPADSIWLIEFLAPGYNSQYRSTKNGARWPSATRRSKPFASSCSLVTTLKCLRLRLRDNAFANLLKTLPNATRRARCLLTRCADEHDRQMEMRKTAKRSCDSQSACKRVYPT